MRAHTLLGLDLSLNASAAVACSTDWDGSWHHVRTLVVGEKLTKAATEAERIGRCSRIADRLVAFARAEGVTVAFLESYAYSQRTSAHSLGELGGIVRLALIGVGVDVQVANMSSARKLMCGTIPRGVDKKATVAGVLRSADAPVELTSDRDLCDAFVCLNFGMAELGGFCWCQEAA